MTFSLPGFQPESSDTLSAFDTVMKQKAMDRLTRAQTQEEDIRNQYLAPSLAEGIKKMQLENQMNQPKADYAKQITLADLLQSQNQGRLIGEQADWYAPKARSDIGLQGAQAARANEETKYIPLEYAIKAAQASNSADRFGGSYQLAKLLQAEGKAGAALFKAQHPEQWDQMVNDLANKSANQQQNQGQQALVQTLAKYYQTTHPQPADQQPTQTDKQQISNNILLGDENQVQNNRFTSSKKDVSQQELSAQNDANRASVDAPIRNRAQGGVALEEWLAKNREYYSKKLNNALDYAGGTGSIQKKIDAISGYVGKSPEKYADYLWAKNSFSGSYANGIKKMEGLGSTDQQRNELRDMVNLAIDKMDIDPESARQLFNDSVQTMQDTASGVFDAAEPLYKGTYRKMGGLVDYKGKYLDSNSSASSGDKSQDTVKIQDPSGGIHIIARDSVDAALKKYPGTKVIG